MTVPSGHAARITIQDLFARWPHLAGMTGTIATSRREIARTYDVAVDVDREDAGHLTQPARTGRPLRRWSE